MEVACENPSPLPSLKVSVSFRSGQSKTLERFFSARTKFDSPAQEKIELFRVFQHFDHNSDGHLTVDEICASLAKLGVLVKREDLESLINPEFPEGGSGFVDFEEFVLLYKDLCRDRCEEEDCITPTGNFGDADLKSAFDLFDKNGDGYISAAELMLVLTNLGFEQVSSLEECQSMISKVDSDGDGKVNFAEFRIMMRNRGED